MSRHVAPDPDQDPTEELNRIDNVLERAGHAVPDPGEADEARLRPALVAVGFALAVVVIAGIAAYVGGVAGYERAADHTDHRIGALEQDLADRRRVRAQEDAARDAQTRELLALVCILLDRAQPRDSEVETLRTKYGCTGGPYLQPSVTPGPQPGSGGSTHTTAGAGAARTSAAAARTTVGAVPPRPTATSSPAAPTPTQAPPPPPPPDSGGGLLCIDLPLLPELCV